MSKKAFWDILKSRITLTAYRDITSNSVIELRFPVLAGIAAALLLSVLLGYGIYVAVLDIDYRLAKESSSAFKDKALFLVQKAGELEEKEKRLGSLEKKLRDLLAYKNKKSLVREEGIGGPSKSDQKVLDKLLSDDIGQEEVSKEYDNLISELDFREQSTKEIFQYVSKLRSVWAATPKGRPVKGWITSRFGARDLIFDFGDDGRGKSRKEYHVGVDIANRIGTPIHATADGTVIFAGRLGGYGNLVILEHDYGYTTRYGHCSRFLVSPGQKVKAGESLALMGSTGSSTGAHVHYEIRKFGQVLDPKSLEPDFYSPYYAKK